jgi:Sortase and related acyltransferases
MDIILDNFISQVCTDLPGRIGSKNTSEDIFLNCGFKKTGQFLRLRIDATVCDFSDCIGEFEYANECDAEEILQLWKNHLQRGNMIPNSFELIHDIAEKRILCIRIGSILASVLRVDLDDKTALIELVVTNPAFRRQGYGKKLLKEAIRFSVNQGFRNCVAWVEQKNSASLGMFETVGFCPDGRVVDKLFLE